MDTDTWYFKIHSGTDDGVWYDAYLRWKDVTELLSNLVKDTRLWTKSKEHVDLRKLAKRFFHDADVQLKCSCPAFQYYGPAYILSLSRYDAKYTNPETRPPRIRNPKQYGAVCKHLQGLLNALPFYLGTMASWLKEHYAKQIAYLEEQAKKEKEELKRAAAELAKRKGEKPKEEETKESKELMAKLCVES